MPRSMFLRMIDKHKGNQIQRILDKWDKLFTFTCSICVADHPYDYEDEQTGELFYQGRLVGRLWNEDFPLCPHCYEEIAKQYDDYLSNPRSD